MPTIITKRLGAGESTAAGNFTTFAELQAWLGAQDLVLQDQQVVVKVSSDLSISSAISIQPATYDANHFVIIEPDDDKNVNLLDASGPLGYGTVGIEITVNNTGSTRRISHGVRLQNFRLNLSGTITTAALFVARGSTSMANGLFNASIRNCRIKVNMSNATACGVGCDNNTSPADVQNNLFFNSGVGPSLRVRNDALVANNTFVHTGSAIGLSGTVITATTTSIIRGNVYHDCGDKPLNRDAGNPAICHNNFANAAITGTSTGFTVASNLIASTSDVRPASGSPLIGAGPDESKNTNDIRGLFRGLVPDVGAAMLASASMPAKSNATITSTTVLGQKVTVSGTYTGTYDSVTATLPAAATPNGAVTATTTPQIGADNTFTAVFNNVTPGNYAPAQVLFTNQSGTGTSTGGQAITVAVPVAPTVEITSQSISGQDVILSGTTTGKPSAGTLQLTPASSNPGGAVAKSAPLQLGDNDTFTVTASGVAYGSYAPPVVQVSNATGPASDEGTAFSLYAPGSQPVGLPVITLPAFVAPAFSTPSIAVGANITDVIFESTGPAQTNVPFTFAQAFKPGELARVNFIVGKIAGESDVPLQFNVKATHNDGSVRHAIVSGVLPALGAAGSQKTMMMVRAASGPALTAAPSASFASNGFNASASLTIGSATYTADATAALAAGLDGDKIWIGGALATEYAFPVPLKDAGGVEHPTLTAYFHIRMYPGAGKAKVDFIIENTKAYTGTADVAYSVSLTLGGVNRFTSNVNHFPAARWRKSFWWNVANPVHIRHNRDYLLDTRAVPNYDRSLVMSESVLAGYATKLATDTNFAIMGRGTIPTAFGGTGARPDIGLNPSWHVAALLSMDKRAKDIALAIGECAGSFPMHRRDESSGPNRGNQLDVMHFPRATIKGTTGDSLNKATGQYEKLPALSTASTYQEDAAHQPAPAYIPYLLTGDLFFLEQLLFWNNYNMYMQNPAVREYHAGLYVGGQCRAQAWTLRTQAQTAYITPDDHYYKPRALYWLDNNINYFVDRYVLNFDNNLGINSSDLVYDPEREGIAYPNTGAGNFQDDFFTQAVGMTVELGFTKAQPLLDFKAKYPVGRMIAPGYCWIDGSIYTLRVRDSESSPFYNTLGECLQKTLSATRYNLPCNSLERLEVYKQESGNVNYVLGEMTGYSSSVTGFVANMQPALAYAVMSNVPDADLAWLQFQSRTIKPDYSTEAQFAVMPRAIEAEPGATLITLQGSSTGTVGEASAWFNVGTNGAISAEISVTLSDGAGGGTFSPNPVILSPMAQSAAASYTPTSAGTKTISATNNAGLGNPPAVTLTATTAPDTTAPTLPGPLTLSSITSDGFIFSWPAGADNVGVTGYESSIDGGITWQDMGNVRSRAVTNATAGTSYSLGARAYDAAGNRSDPLLGTVRTEDAVVVTDFTPSTARTLIATTDSARPYTAAPGGFWNTIDAKKPYGPMDPNNKIDFSIEWSAILADMGEQTTIAKAEVIPPAGLSVLAQKVSGGTKQSAVFEVTTPPNPNNAKVPVLYRITASGDPSRVFDRTFYLNIEET